MMGYEKERFVSEIDDNLICTICDQVFENPKQLISCKHIFCFDCIEKYVINGNNCPLDKTHIDSSEIEDAPKHIIDYVSMLRVRCDFANYGCKDVMWLKSLMLHRLNCEYHPQRKTKCDKCGLEVEKAELITHDCVKILKNTIETQNQQIEQMKETHSKEISTIKSLLQRMQWELEEFRQQFSSNLGSDAYGLKRQMISFSCITDSQSGTHEIIFIQTISITFKCEANLLTKIGQIKYIASTLANLNTNDYSLYSNGVKLEDQYYLSHYNIHTGSMFHLFPNHIHITFDCVDIRIILGMSVRTNDTIKAITLQLMNEIRNLIPQQLYLYLKSCDCSLYYNDIKLEETYQLSNYDVLLIQTLKYSNRIGI